MSRGPGRWQRLLLHELYHTELQPDFFGRRGVSPRRYMTTRSEMSAVYRAARALCANGWAATLNPPWFNSLGPCDPPPAAADPDRCPLCKCCQTASPAAI